jgi:hypothetical protein
LKLILPGFDLAGGGEDRSFPELKLGQPNTGADLILP